jgi:hypothetical protein
MFRRDLDTPDQTRTKNGDDSDLANSAAYQGLLEGILEYQQAGVLNLNDPQVMAMSAWSIAHGLFSQPHRNPGRESHMGRTLGRCRHSHAWPRHHAAMSPWPAANSGWVLEFTDGLAANSNVKFLDTIASLAVF